MLRASMPSPRTFGLAMVNAPASSRSTSWYDGCAIPLLSPEGGTSLYRCPVGGGVSPYRCPGGGTLPGCGPPGCGPLGGRPPLSPGPGNCCPPLSSGYCVIVIVPFCATNNPPQYRFLTIHVTVSMLSGTAFRLRPSGTLPSVY